MITLDRFKTGEYGTFGTLLDEFDAVLCQTLERPYTGDHPCIPAGVYTVEPYQSPKHGNVWQIMNVHGRTNIEIHPANFSSQLLGCIAVGDCIGSISGIPAVLNSQKTFSLLKSKLPDSFQLTITGV